MTLITYEAIRAAQRSEQAEQLQKLPENFFEAVKNWFEYKQGKGDELSAREIESAKKLLEDITNRRQRKLLFRALATVRGDLPPEGLDNLEKDFFNHTIDIVKDFRVKTKERFLTEEGVAEKKIEEVSGIVDELRKPVAPEKNEIGDVSKDDARDISSKETSTKEQAGEQLKKPASSVSDMHQKPTEPKTENLLLSSKPQVTEKKQALNNVKRLKVLSDLPRFVGTDLKAYGPYKTEDIITVPDEIYNLLLKRKVAEQI